MSKIKTVKKFNLTFQKVRLDCRVCNSYDADRTNIPQIVRSLLRRETKHSKFLVFFLGIAGDILGYAEVAEGCQDQITIETISVFRTAVLLSCRSIVVAHNHPKGGGLTEYDLNVTKSIMDAANIVGIPLVEHFVLTGDQVLSTVNALANNQPVEKIRKRRRRNA